jgi:predicted nucleic acid-binding protein
MRRVFLDTSYLLALLLRKDERHEAALKCQQQFEGELITTEYVLVEFHDALSQAALRPLAISAIDRLLSDPNVAVIRSSESLFDRGRQLFRSRPDKDWSLTDCISFVTMQDQGLRDAMTYDHHFDQAGFHPLMK